MTDRGVQVVVTIGAEHFRKKLARRRIFPTVATHLSALSPKTDTPRRETTCPLWVMCGQCLGKNFTPKADMCDATGDVRFGPKADINVTWALALPMRLLDYVSNFVLWTYKYDLVFSDEEFIRSYFRHFLHYVRAIRYRMALCRQS
jgi:hypothetical protein